ncbi:MAG TPA: helix-turn-helix domain-containing protein [Steroidobacteraceae bacterium]|nr:helix-turn-helix domain-containing protein [Steroidobacteraceae bacterium]
MAPKNTMNTRKSSKDHSIRTATANHVNGHGGDYQHVHVNGHHANGNAITLRNQTARALDIYFSNLNGHTPGALYDLVLREVEEPLFRAVLGYVDGNRSRAAEVLGINRGTLRKKLREYGLHGD